MNNQEYRWVVGAYQGERAKSVLAHAGAGIGYRILQQTGRGPSLQVAAAFRCCEFPIPHNLTEIRDQYKIDQLENRR